MRTIAIIGAGNMGGAIARGIAKASPETALRVSNPSAGKLDALRADCPGIYTTNDNADAASVADIVILAVKPWLMSSVIESISTSVDLGRKVVVSVAGGMPIAAVEDLLRKYSHSANTSPSHVMRVIPDTALSVGKSMTFVSASRVDPLTVEFVCELFGALGRVALIDEAHMEAATALSSCGIAYAYKYVQACVQAGVQLGFRPADALAYTLATVDGAISMLAVDGTTPQQEIDKVTTPGGMTIKGINCLEHAGFTSAVIRAILAPLQKS